MGQHGGRFRDANQKACNLKLMNSMFLELSTYRVRTVVGYGHLKPQSKVVGRADCGVFVECVYLQRYPCLCVQTPSQQR